MLTKSVKSAISVVLKHVARAKKICAIGVIREHTFLMFVCGVGGVVVLFLGGGGWVCGVFVLIL